MAGRPPNDFCAKVTIYIEGYERARDLLDWRRSGMMRQLVQASAYDIIREGGDRMVLFAKRQIFSGNYNKPPWDTGSMHSTIRALAEHPTGNIWSRKIVVGQKWGTQKFVNYQTFVHEGMGRHRGNPRRFMKDAIEANWRSIVNHACQVVVKNMRKILV